MQEIKSNKFVEVVKKIWEYAKKVFNYIVKNPTKMLGLLSLTIVFFYFVCDYTMSSKLTVLYAIVVLFYCFDVVKNK